MSNLRKDPDFLDDHVDDHVDEEIKNCIMEDNPRSFFMFAGAGSGKTRSLINILSFINKELGEEFSIYSRQVAVITYTNAACDEISRRLNFESLFAVSTIHNFLWNLIKPYQQDIKIWVIDSIEKEILELKEKQSKGRGGDAATKRLEKIEQKYKRLEKIKTIEKFSYNPNGENVGYDSLNHSEVIKMGAYFIAKEETMQKVLIGKYPILFIDESQDTKKDLVDALLVVYEKYKKQFVIGMFGDMMQRIYMDGKDNLALHIPHEWSKPNKVMNHRSSRRIVDLANTIRKTIDDQKQRSRSDAETGTVRLFIVSNTSNKESVEEKVQDSMAKITADSNWLISSKYKSLILEHHMAASRFGFSDLYKPLHESKKFDTSLREGSIPEIFFLAKVISPLINAYKNKKDFEISKIIRKHSPFFERKNFEDNSTNQIKLLNEVEKSFEKLTSLWKDDKNPTCLEILNIIKETNLFALNPRVNEILSAPYESEDIRVTALRKSLSVPFDQLERYFAYVADETQYATHQGVKGLEFPRVMVSMDDSEAKGFMFSYEKLFGATPKTDKDLENERNGKDTGLSRTIRLFYVACTRAEKSLAVIAYTKNKDAVMKTAIENKWFSKEEIELL
ncbi:UvrD-helicase domain-containing protein [Enterococcus malodoratus]|uniref:UvrD-helicase domain-containing protein n=1 Tax=Enterococcus malodoratus TaxID=71451 RepID=UPI0039B031AA